MESFDFSSDSILYEILCFAAGDQTACNLAGFRNLSDPNFFKKNIWLVLIHNVFNAAAYPFSGALSNGLRAAGDVKFTMYVSVISTIAVRLLLSWLLGIVLKMGVIGIAIAMVCDWSIRAVIFFWRQKSGKWKTFQVI